MLVPSRIRLAHETPDGTLQLLAGHVRLEYGHGLAIAEETAPGTRTVEVFPDASYFWDESGAVLRAEGGYLGPLVEVARAPRPIAHGITALGLLAAVTADGELFLFTPEAGVHRPAAPADRDVRDAGWSRRDLGALLLNDGTVLRARDGGRRVEPITVPEETVLEVFPMDDAVYLRLASSRWARVSETEAVVIEQPRASSFREPPDEALRSLRARLGPLIAWAGRSMPLHDGRRGILTDGELQGWSPSEGWIETRPRGASGCMGQLLEAGWVALCEQGAELRFSPDGAAWTSFRMPAPVAVTGTSPDGSSVVLSGQCELDRSELGVCWSGGEAPRLLSLSREAAVLAVDGTTLVVGEAERLVALDVETAVTRDLGASEGLVSARTTADGAIVLVHQQGETVSVTVVADEATDRHDAPPGTLDVAFADALHGVAVGDTFSELWATSDGGSSFAPLDVERLGSPATTALDPATLTCSAGGCRVANVLFFGPTSLRPVEGPRRLCSPRSRHHRRSERAREPRRPSVVERPMLDPAPGLVFSAL